MTNKMKAVGFYEGLAIDDVNSFINEKIDIPTPSEHDLLIKVSAISLNPVDTKIRKTTDKQEQLKVIGYDGIGEVVDVGSEVKGFKQGDRVFYSGTSTRAGSNQEYQLVDERITAQAPVNLTDIEAVSLPLTALTAYELLFEKFNLIPNIDANQGKSILIINGAGGVGSIMTQLAKWAGLTVYATASPKNFGWLKDHGVDYPIDYHENLVNSFNENDIITVDYVASLFDITQYFEQLTQLIAPFGHIGTIVGFDHELDISRLKSKSVSFDWEYMFSKTEYNADIESQGKYLSHISMLANAGYIKSATNKVYDTGINADTLKVATKELEAGHTVGKIVICGGFK